MKTFNTVFATFALAIITFGVANANDNAPKAKAACCTMACCTQCCATGCCSDCKGCCPMPCCNACK